MEAKHILIPLEPGSGGETLIRSGIKLASALKAKLTFLYVMTASGYAGYTGSMAVASMVSLKEQKENIETHYIEILKKFKDYIPASMAIERSITEGPWVPSIIDYLNKHQADILLLKHVEQGFIEKVLGDSNTEILNSAEIPVWIIPGEGISEMPKNIAYITDHRASDIEAIRQIHSLCKSFKASFHLVHVHEPDEFEARIKKEGFKVVVEKELKECEPEHFDIIREKMTTELNDMIREKKIDLLCMMNESENFLNRFFTRSSVEKLIDSVDIPLAIYS
ncbi:MAG: universal stress protein [Bacteroidales bacterium]|nr:universal stress protein [Bacteroidales bacterium]